MTFEFIHLTKRIQFLAPLFIFTSALLIAQFRGDQRRAYVQEQSPLSIEFITYAETDTSTVSLQVLYRLHANFLVFAKQKTNQLEFYQARAELLIEIFNEKNETVARDFRPIVYERNTSPTEAFLNTDFIQGHWTFTLKRGKYHFSIEAKDIESDRTYDNRNLQIDIPLFVRHALQPSPIILLETQTAKTPDLFSVPAMLMNYGNAVLIGQQARAIFQLVTPDTIHPIKVSWEIKGREESEEEFHSELHDSIFTEYAGIPQVVDTNNRPALLLRQANRHTLMIVVPLNTEQLETRFYHLSVSIAQDTMKATQKYSFRVIWPNRPQSLEDFRIATEALQHIATEKEYDEITSASTSKARQLFKEFWKKHSPDSTKAYNPMMAEYYRRVDEAMNRFSSSNERDGFKTDRGRIYILFGTPTMTNRLLKPNSPPTELWTYEKLRKRFIFTDSQKTGNYILTKTEEY